LEVVANSSPGFGLCLPRFSQGQPGFGEVFILEIWWERL
jgi:hypothetical protein